LIQDWKVYQRNIFLVKRVVKMSLNVHLKNILISKILAKLGKIVNPEKAGIF
jgi:hypothetical protein